MRPKERDLVRLHTPENARLHGAVGRVRTLTEWGAFVATHSAATGEYRAAWSEMVPVEHDGNGHAPTTAVAVMTARETAGEGNPCVRCGSLRMMRSGACVTCLDCGESGGCS